MEEAYKKAGAKVHEMTQGRIRSMGRRSRSDTAWKEFASKSAQGKELLDLLLQVK